MQRKHFLSSLIPAALLLSAEQLPANIISDKKLHPIRIPPYLVAGDTIGVTSPAGFITVEDIQPAVQLMQSWGFKIEVGSTIGKRDFTFGGTDAERTADLQQMLDNPKIKAIMCARGGYGLVRIIDQLDFRKFQTQPKWIVGFSDITVLHSHIHQNFQIATLHSKMCNSFPQDWNLAEPIQTETILSIKEALTGGKMVYTSPVSEFNRLGKASGELVGGNLSLLATLSGSKSDISTKGKILFVEDTNEQLYNLDRMFYNLKRSNKLNELSGLIIGGFKIKPDDAGEEFGRTLPQIVLEKVKNFDFPVCFDFPVGHQKNNFALKCGAIHMLEVDAGGGKLVSA